MRNGQIEDLPSVAKQRHYALLREREKTIALKAEIAALRAEIAAHREKTLRSGKTRVRAADEALWAILGDDDV